MDNFSWIPTLISILTSNTFAVIIGALLAAYFGFNFGFRQYRNQKCLENIDKRYFREGIENVISWLDNIRKTTEETLVRINEFFHFEVYDTIDMYLNIENFNQKVRESPEDFVKKWKKKDIRKI